MNDDLEIDDILKETKKKKNGCRKGKSVERQLCKIFSDTFGCSFTRSIGSGNRWGQVKLSERAKQVFSGDICVPEGFKWVIESKGGYEDKIDLNNVGSIPQLDHFIQQSMHDSEFCGRQPIICWKRNRKPWLACVRLTDIGSVPEYCVIYNTWVIVPLTFLLEKEISFWFEDGK